MQQLNIFNDNGLSSMGNKFIIMFGGLHVEMAVFKAIEGLLKDSGWTTALTEAGLASSGTAESFLTVS